MMKTKTKIVSVRISDIDYISEKAVKLTDFNGNSDIFPKSQIFGTDYSVLKSEAIWVAEWILKQKSITYSSKKTAWYNSKTREIEKNHIIIETHIPQSVSPIDNNEIEDLKIESI